MIELRALSLSQPWAWAMTVPPIPDRKEVENRSWPCPDSMIGKRFAIHAAKSWDDNGALYLYREGCKFPPKATITRGAIVALATISHQVTNKMMPPGSSIRFMDSLPESQARWFFGPFGFVFTQLEVLKKPVPCRGLQGFWPVPPDVTGEVIGQLVVDGNAYLEARRGTCGDVTDEYAALLLDKIRNTGLGPHAAANRLTEATRLAEVL